MSKKRLTQARDRLAAVYFAAMVRRAGRTLTARQRQRLQHEAERLADYALGNEIQAQRVELVNEHKNLAGVAS